MPENEEMIVYAYSIDGNGSGKPLYGDEIGAMLKSDALAWVHLDLDHPDTRAWLEKEITYLDPIIIDALLAEETRPRVLEFQEGVLIIMRGVNLNENARPEDMVSVRLWIDERRIISVRRRKLKAVQDMRESLVRGDGPTSVSQFLITLITRLFERMEPVLTELHDNLDEAEERIMEVPELEERAVVTQIRKQAIMLRRYISPQKEVISHLGSSDLQWLDLRDRRRLQESYDRVTRYIEDLDAIRERAQIVKDELANTLADRMNKNMYVLSVIAAIFLPLGFLTGLLGVNVAGIPGADNPQAFMIFCLILSILVAGQIALFKKFKWF